MKILSNTHFMAMQKAVFRPIMGEGTNRKDHRCITLYHHIRINYEDEKVWSDLHAIGLGGVSADLFCTATYHYVSRECLVLRIKTGIIPSYNKIVKYDGMIIVEPRGVYSRLVALPCEIQICKPNRSWLRLEVQETFEKLRRGFYSQSCRSNTVFAPPHLS